MDFSSRFYLEKKSIFNKSSINDSQKKDNNKHLSVFKNIASSVLDQSIQRKQTSLKTNSETLIRNELLESKYQIKMYSPTKSNMELMKVPASSFTPQPIKRHYNSNSTGRRGASILIPCFISDNLYEYEKNNFLSVSPTNLSNFFKFLSIWNDIDTSSNKNNLYSLSKRFVFEFDSYFIRFHNTINIFEDNSLNLIIQKTYKFSLIIVALVIIVLGDSNDSANSKNNFKKMISTLNDAMCIIYEVFIFHDKNTFVKEISKELSEKVQKIANIHYNTLLNKSFKKNKIKDILQILNKILDNLLLQIKTFITSEILNIVLVKICVDLIEKIDEVKFTHFGTLVINNLLFSFLKEKKEFISEESIDDMNMVNDKPPYLPNIRNEYKYTVVLDLDETLIHFLNNHSKEQFIVRPKAMEFIKEVSKFSEVVIFTSATKDYADTILDKIDPLYSFIKYRLYRQHTKKHDDIVFKDLSDLGRDLTKVVMIDNLEENYINQYDNGLLSLTWIDDIFDTQLNDFLVILKFINENQIENIPKFIRKINTEIDKFQVANKKENLYNKINLKSLIF